MFFTGTAVFLGLLLIFVKMQRRTMLKWLHHDMALDVAVTLLVLCLHWGSFEGVMAATIAGLMTSLTTSTAKKLFGHIDGCVYHPGLMALSI